MSDKKTYWFSAKSYGWNSGFPNVWQGWLVYGIAATFFVAGFFIFPPVANPLIFSVYTWSVVMFLVAVCRLKSEPPHWRQGK